MKKRFLGENANESQFFFAWFHEKLLSQEGEIDELRMKEKRKIVFLRTSEENVYKVNGKFFPPQFFLFNFLSNQTTKNVKIVFFQNKRNLNEIFKQEYKENKENCLMGIWWVAQIEYRISLIIFKWVWPVNKIYIYPQPLALYNEDTRLGAFSPPAFCI